MTTAERIEAYTKAAAASGLPVKEMIIEKGKVRILFFHPDESDDEPMGLNHDWTPR